ncbi:hypothetical protein V8E36_001313 [Tilletia maclaganii]
MGFIYTARMGFIYNALRGFIHIARLGFIYIARMDHIYHAFYLRLNSCSYHRGPPLPAPRRPRHLSRLRPLRSPPSASPGLVLPELLQPTLLAPLRPVASPCLPPSLCASSSAISVSSDPVTPTNALPAADAADAPHPRCGAQAAPIRADLPPTPYLRRPNHGQS